MPTNALVVSLFSMIFPILPFFFLGTRGVPEGMMVRLVLSSDVVSVLAETFLALMRRTVFSTAIDRPGRRIRPAAETRINSVAALSPPNAHLRVFLRGLHHHNHQAHMHVVAMEATCHDDDLRRRRGRCSAAVHRAYAAGRLGTASRPSSPSRRSKPRCLPASVIPLPCVTPMRPCGRGKIAVFIAFTFGASRRTNAAGSPR